MPRSIKTFQQAPVAVAVLTAAAPFAAASAAGGDAGETVKPVAAHELPNLLGKQLIAVVVTYAPGGKSARHHHAGSVWAYVLSGAIRSQNSATGPAKCIGQARASSSRRAASMPLARTPARPSRQACLPSTSPNTARS
jgi:hypothetical protein